LARAGWTDDGTAIIGVVSRLVDQKGIDFLLGAVPYLEGMGARVVLLGSGLQWLTDWVRHMVGEHPDVLFAEVDKYDEPFAHLIFAGSDLFCMPSRFEPCGLAQMQAMAYGTPTIATAVGGLVDTIVDADADPAEGTGFLTRTVDVTGLVDALHRGLRAHRSDPRLAGIVERGMSVDWSWAVPAAEHRAIYRELADLARRPDA
jgi:starch synthase